MVESENLRKSLAFTLQWEVGNAPNGGYTNDPDDPGGETKYGISKRSHPSYDIKSLTPDQALKIYSDEYWDRCGCDTLVFPVCTAVFDTAVNVGVDRALNWLRNSANVHEFLNRRRMHYYELVNKKPSQVKYLKGWLARCSDLSKYVDINSSMGVTPDPIPKWGSLG